MSDDDALKIDISPKLFFSIFSFFSLFWLWKTHNTPHNNITTIITTINNKNKNIMGVTRTKKSTSLKRKRKDPPGDDNDDGCVRRSVFFILSFSFSFSNFRFSPPFFSHLDEASLARCLVVSHLYLLSHTSS